MQGKIIFIKMNMKNTEKTDSSKQNCVDVNLEKIHINLQRQTFSKRVDTLYLRLCHCRLNIHLHARIQTSFKITV